MLIAVARSNPLFPGKGERRYCAAYRNEKGDLVIIAKSNFLSRCNLAAKRFNVEQMNGGANETISG